MIRRLVLLAAIAGLLVVACDRTPQATETPPAPAVDTRAAALASPTAEKVSTPTTGATAKPTAKAAATPTTGATAEPTPTETSEPTEETAPEPTESPTAPPPPVKQSLTATDPATVSLASGQPQLIEFFAFW